METTVHGTVVENPAEKEKAPRKKVLLSFVGMRDPYNDNVKTKPCTTKTPPQPKPMGFFSRIGQYLHGNPSTPVASAPVSVAPSDAPRPREDWGSILTICEHIQPDIVYLFPSSKGKNPRNNTEGKAEKVKAILMEKRGGRSSFLCNILPLDIQDATDFEEISVEVEKNIDAVLHELGELAGYEFHWNCSSGTQQMAAVGYVFANSGKIPEIKRWQCKDPERLRPGEERLREINTAFLDENVYRKRIEASMEHLAFLSVKENSEALFKIAGSEKQRQIGTLLSQVFDAYLFMDVLRYQDAYVKLRDVEQNPDFGGLMNAELKDILKEQVETLKILQGGSIKETSQNLVDLYFNMQRCFERGNYADVLARFWRMGEGSLYYRLESEWGINARDLDASPDRRNLTELRKFPRYQPTGHWKEFIGFEGGRKALLDVFKDKAYVGMWDAYSKKCCFPNGKVKSENTIINLIGKRNESIVAHGMRPVSKENADDCLPIAEAMLLALVPDAEQRIREYPFKKELIERWMTLF